MDAASRRDYQQLDSPPEDRMVFLLGRGRSGTTLLSSILDAHPAVSVAPEALFVMNLHRKYKDGGWSERRIRQFARDVFLEDRMCRWNVSREDVSARCAALAPNPGFARLCAEVYEAHAAAAGKARGRLLGVKNPHFSLFTDEVIEMFPRGRFVHVVRDYRDNVRSYQRVPFDLSSPAALAYRWVAYNSKVLTTAARRPEQFHRVRFEDLVTAPGPTIAALCQFLGIDMHTAMLRPHEREYGPSVAWHRVLNQPIDARLAGEWQREMSADQVALLDRICQPLGRRFGYEPADADSTPRRGAGGVLLGWTVTWLERVLFRLPVRFQAAIIRAYRRLTGNVIR